MVLLTICRLLSFIEVRHLEPLLYFRYNVSGMYNLTIAYILWLLSGCGALGFHRFYLGKIPSGILWMLTGGLGMVGSVFDLITLPAQVQEANLRKALYDRGYSQNRENPETIIGKPDNWRYANDAQYKVMSNDHKKEHPERLILKLAKENNGVLTVSEVALGADIPIDEAKKILETLVSKGFAELRVRKSGSLVYVIPDMMDKDEPLEEM